jgi:uncharacterized membrane protein
MPIFKLIYTFAAMAVAFMAVDLLWLGLIAKKIYQNQIGHLMKTSPNWTAALIFYALFIIGTMIFCVIPAAEKNSLNHALLYGALFGFFTYMTYEITNYAVLKTWPLGIVPIDIIWGIALTSIISIVGFLVIKI